MFCLRSRRKEAPRKRLAYFSVVLLDIKVINVKDGQERKGKRMEKCGRRQLKESLRKLL